MLGLDGLRGIAVLVILVGMSHWFTTIRIGAGTYRGGISIAVTGGPSFSA